MTQMETLNINIELNKIVIVVVINLYAVFPPSNIDWPRFELQMHSWNKIQIKIS